MTTADWALVISIFSAAVSLAGFVWNVWSKFIYPKPRVRVSFSMVSVVEFEHRNPDPVRALSLSATNMGPSEVTLVSALVVFERPHWLSDKSYGVLNVLPGIPQTTDYKSEYHRMGGSPFVGFPRKLAVGESFTVYMVPNHESLARGDYNRIGFNDTFGKMHWAPRVDILKTLPSIREACEKSGKDWRTRD
jgi:hypothetical protein